MSVWISRGVDIIAEGVLKVSNWRPSSFSRAKVPEKSEEEIALKMKLVLGTAGVGQPWTRSVRSSPAASDIPACGDWDRS